MLGKLAPLSMKLFWNCTVYEVVQFIFGKVTREGPILGIANVPYVILI